MKIIKNIWFIIFVFISCLLILMMGCTGKSISNNPNIINLKTFKTISVGKWRDTKIQVSEGDAIILTPLYPKGFIYSVKCRIGDRSDDFDALDVDVGDIYTVKSPGTLHIGVETKSNSIQTGVFIFNNSNLDNIISDLTHLQTISKNSKVIKLTLGILFMIKCDDLKLTKDDTEALKYLDIAVDYFKSIDEKLYSTTIYRLYKMKADLYKKNEDFENFDKSIRYALDSLMKASEYYTRLHDRKYSFLKSLTQEERYLLLTKTAFFSKTAMPYDVRWGHSFANLSYTYFFLGKYYTELGDLRSSLKYHEKSIQEAKQDGNENLIAYAYGELGARHERFHFFKRAEEAVKIGLSYCSHTAEWTHFSLNERLQRIRYYKNKDFKSYEKHLKTLEAKLLGKAKIRPLVISLELAWIYMDQHEYQKAISRLERLYTSFKNISGPSELSTRSMHIIAGLALCKCYLAVDRFEEAMEFFRIIENDIINLGDPIKLKLRAMIIKSNMMQQTGKDFVTPLMEAIESLEKIRPTATSSSDYEYWENMLNIYNKAIDSLYQQGEFIHAIEVAKKARSRRFLDYFGNKKLGAKSDIGYYLSQQAKERLEALLILENDMIRAAEKSGIKVRNVYQEGSRYSKRLESCRSTFRNIARFDRQFGVMYNITPISFKSIQQKIPDNTTIIEYFLSDDTLYIWVIDQKSLSAKKIDISRNKIEDLIVAFRKSMVTDTFKRGIKTADKQAKDYTKEDRALFELLFASVAKYIKNDKISIVPYGILNYLPFQALHDGEQYLIERYAISYIPSLSILEFIKKTERKDNLAILAFGNPDLNNAAFDLPAAEKEVEMIKTLFPPTTVLKKEKATEARAKKMAAQYDIIHFASHGEYTPEDPLASCIRLSPDDKEDGNLEAREVFDMEIKADLVVTSACKTALGRINKGDEIIGLTRAFLYAGANSVFGSLWNISDEATSVLMKEFYSNMLQIGKVQALREAQIKMIQSSEFSQPFYWAAFNITGGF